MSTATITTPDISLELVKTNPENFDFVTAYEEQLGPEFLAELRELLPKLKDVKMAHVNATAYGGGVAELLHRQIPLLNQLGKEVNFHSDWYIMQVSNTAFYDVTKKMHNTLQGAEGELTAAEKDLYKKIQIENFSNGLLSEYDVVLIHDPQPAGLIDLYSKDRNNKWAWRCHIDTTTTNANVWGFIGEFAKKYDTAIWTRDAFVQDRADFKDIKIIPPSIDPLSPKNYQLTETQIDDVFHRYGIDRSRPVLCQISRFDPWKQPVEVVKIYQELKQEFPELQLIYAGSMATDDPEGMHYWEQTLRAAGLDKDVTILNNFHGVGNIEINAFQRGATVMVQYSSKEGFGLTISEAMYKEQPIIGGRVGGIQDQIVDKECGYLVSTNEEVKAAIREQLSNAEKRKEMGKKAKKRVEDNFLITREVGNYMKLAISLLGR